MSTPSFDSPSNVTVISVPAVPAPKVSALPSSFVIGPPSAVVPSCVCPVDAAKAANN